MQLTDDQKAAHAAFTAFMVSPDKEMVISGPAGVGKSTLLKFLMQDQDHIKIQRLLGEDVIDDWMLTATTNKAAEVLQGSTGEEASTVHSALKIQVQPDFATGGVKLSRKANAEVITNKVLIVDECSMIDTRLDNLIDQSTFQCKILYVGDHCQMAPVGEAISPVFRRNTPVQLNQVVRSQHTPAITALCAQLRQTVETLEFKPILPVPGVIDYLGPEDAMDELRWSFVLNPENLGKHARVLAYRNEQVIGFNNWIRNERGMPPNLTAGEWVVSNAATKLMNSATGRLRIEQEVPIIDIGPVENFHVGGITTPVRMALTGQGGVWMPEDSNHVSQLLKHFAKIKDWTSFYKIKEHLADLRPRDAATVYKSQGSTYHTVFVDLRDIGRCPNPSQAARMLYVACSRPTHRIVFIGDLPERFRGG